MVRGERVKEYRFGAETLTGSNLSATYTSGAINGTIQRIDLLAGNTVTTGSLWVAESGTNNELFRINGTPATHTVRYPREFAVDTTNASQSGTSTATLVPHTVNNILFIAGSGGIAGSQFPGMTIYYI